MRNKLPLSFFSGVIFSVMALFIATTSPAHANDEAAVASGTELGALLADAGESEELSAETLDKLGSEFADDHRCHQRCEREYRYCRHSCGHGHHGHHCKERCRWRFDRCIRHCHHR